MPTTQAFFDFLDKYKGRPTTKGMDKFFHDDLMVSAVSEGSCEEAAAFEKSGNLTLCIDTLEKLTSGEGWVLVTPFGSESMKMISIIPQIPDNWFILDDVKAFRELAKEKNYVALISHQSETTLHSMEEMPDEGDWGDISVGGVWFDSDDDWNYTYLSRFFQNFVDFNDEDTKAWLIQISEPMMGELLNWVFEFYDSLFEIVGVKV